MNLGSLLQANREAIARKWANALRSKSAARYKIHTLKEISALCTEAVDAYYLAIAKNDLTGIDHWAEKIAGLTLQNRMELSAVQNDCDLYRSIVTPIFVGGVQPKDLRRALARLNRCVTYTITRFSDFFETLYHKEIKEYADTLEQKVIKGSRELAEAEAKYLVLVEEINDGYFVELDQKIVFANRAFCKMHGYEKEEVIGLHFTELIARESLDRIRTLQTQRLRGEEVINEYTHFRRHKDGTSLPTETKAEVIQFQGRLATFGICRDISERIKMEQRVRDAENLAHIGQLATSLAHEIRNPLSSIKMCIQFALDGFLDGSDEKESLEISAKEIHRLERILSEMLDLARPVSLTPQATSANDIVSSSLLLLQHRFREKKITVVKKLSDELPSVSVDAGKIEQAMLNVLLNAVEAVDELGEVTVTTEVSEDQQHVFIKVSDDGPGIHPEDILCLFDPFFTKKKNGTGLGLFNVKKIIEAHNGTVSVIDSHKGLSLLIALPA